MQLEEHAVERNDACQGSEDQPQHLSWGMLHVQTGVFLGSAECGIQCCMSSCVISSEVELMH